MRSDSLLIEGPRGSNPLNFPKKVRQNNYQRPCQRIHVSDPAHIKIELRTFTDVFEGQAQFQT